MKAAHWFCRSQPPPRIKNSLNRLRFSPGLDSPLCPLSQLIGFRDVDLFASIANANSSRSAVIVELRIIKKHVELFATRRKIGSWTGSSGKVR